MLVEQTLYVGKRLQYVLVTVYARFQLARF